VHHEHAHPDRDDGKAREYPDIPDEALEELLSFHDRRECECVKIAAECSVATEFIRKYPDYTDAQLVCMMRFHDDRVCECRERLEKDIGKYNA